MSPRLGEMLYWMAYWIAHHSGDFGVAAVLQGGRREDWARRGRVLLMSVTLWLVGRVLRFISKEK